MAALHLIILVALSTTIHGLDYSYNSLAGGWLKLHQAATWDDATVKCDSEGGVLASPVNSQIRDGIGQYLKKVSRGGATLLTGVMADFNRGDYYSVEGVALKKMPVIFDSSDSTSDTCLHWMTGKAEVKAANCNNEAPFVCFKKRKNLAVVGCGTLDPEYVYYELSGSCYKFHTKGLPWTKAYNKCKAEGAKLAVANSALESRVLAQHFAKYPSSSFSNSVFDHAFLGIRDWQDGDTWKTVDGEKLEDSGFNKWGAGEINNLGGLEHCVSLFREGTYNDENCAISLVYICEKKPEILYT